MKITFISIILLFVSPNFSMADSNGSGELSFGFHDGIKYSERCIVAYISINDDELDPVSQCFTDVKKQLIINPDKGKDINIFVSVRVLVLNKKNDAIQSEGKLSLSINRDSKENYFFVFGDKCSPSVKRTGNPWICIDSYNEGKIKLFKP